MEVSRSRFYAYLHRLERPDDPDLLASKARIEAIFKKQRGKYGSCRIVKQLEVDSRHTFPVALNLLNCKFDVDEPNRFWATDITRTKEASMPAMITENDWNSMAWWRV